MWLSNDLTHRHPASAGFLCAGNGRFRPKPDAELAAVNGSSTTETGHSRTPTT
jgi:hypothetical protein